MGKLKGIFAGLLLGGLAGLLFAPKKGKDLRNSIKQDIEGGHYGLNALKSAFTAMGKDMGNFTSEVTKNKDVKEYLEKGKKAAKDVRDRATLWLEANYGITEQDIEDVKKHLKARGKKAGAKVNKIIKKAQKTAKKATTKAKRKLKK